MPILFLSNWSALACVAIPSLWLCIQNLSAELPEGVSTSDLKWTIGWLIFYLVICTIAVPVALWALLWAKWGRQVIDISPARITVRTRPVLRRGRRVIDRQHAEPIHLRPDPRNAASATGEPARAPWCGWLECRDQGATHHFGFGLTRSESEYLLDQLRRMDPSLVEVG